MSRNRSRIAFLVGCSIGLRIGSCVGSRVAAVVLTVGLACAPMGAQAVDEIVIGASLPLSGRLADIGKYQKWGYETAVNDANKAGGLSVGGKKMQVKLIVRDDKTDPSVMANNTEALISREGALAMLGSCTPSLVSAGAMVAERLKVPLVSGCHGLDAFKSVRKWNYAWVMFVDEREVAIAPFRLMSEMGLPNNRRIAVLTGNGPHGQLMGGQIWPDLAKALGYKVAQNTPFAIDTLQFTTLIAQAKTADADIALVVSNPAQAIAMRKQRATASYMPKLLVIDKGGETEQFAQALGALSDGVLVSGYWDPTAPYPGAAELAKRFETETKQTQSQRIADSHAAAQVLLDAISAAGSLDREKINGAIAKTNKSYVIGPVKFDASNTSSIPVALMQWQGGKSVVVWPTERANGRLIYPLGPAN